MGDVPVLPKPEPTGSEEFAAKLVDLRNRLDDGARLTLTGDRAKSIRRPVLFILVGLGLLIPGLGVFALPALIVLALTDQVVEL